MFIFEALSYIKIKKKILPDIKVNLRLFDKDSFKSLISSGIWQSVQQINIILFIGLDPSKKLSVYGYSILYANIDFVNLISVSDNI